MTSGQRSRRFARSSSLGALALTSGQRFGRLAGRSRPEPPLRWPPVNAKAASTPPMHRFTPIDDSGAPERRLRRCARRLLQELLAVGQHDASLGQSARPLPLCHPSAMPERIERQAPQSSLNPLMAATGRGSPRRPRRRLRSSQPRSSRNCAVSNSRSAGRTRKRNHCRPPSSGASSRCRHGSIRSSSCDRPTPIDSSPNNSPKPWLWPSPQTRSRPIRH